MPEGEVLSAEPRSLKRIYPFNRDRIEKDSNKGRGKNIAKDASTLFTKLKSRDTPLKSEDLEDLLPTTDEDHKFDEIFKIELNNPSPEKIFFTKDNPGEVPHIDGILKDNETGNLFYYIMVGPDAAKLEAGNQIWYTNEYCGICEVILYDRDNNIIPDRNVVVRYVIVGRESLDLNEGTV